jgi:chemotaxis response regulator CheB
VYGMPREAVRLGAVGMVLPLQRISSALCSAFSNANAHLSKAAG